jgi:hypothetical protein
MALPPTLLQEKNNPFHIDKASPALYTIDEERREEARALRGRRRDELLASPASSAVDEERREEARSLRGRRRDELLVSWEAQGAEAGVNAIAMTSASPASYAVDEERREEARALRGRRRDELLASWEAEGAEAFPIDAARCDGSKEAEPNGVLTAKAAAKARQMMGLKRRRKFTRIIEAPSSTNHKITNFDYAAFREENEMRANENARQVRAAITPAKARSPLSKVKRDRIVLRASLESSAKKRRILAAKCHQGQEKIASLKRINNQLMVDILREKRASNIIIDKAMINARYLSAKALVMMGDADKRYREAQAQVIAEKILQMQEYAKREPTIQGRPLACVKI